MYNKTGYTEVQPVVCQLCNCPKTFGIITDVDIISLQSAYLHNLGKNLHMIVLAQIVQICTLKRDYVNIGYYAEKFGRAAV